MRQQLEELESELMEIIIPAIPVPVNS